MKIGIPKELKTNENRISLTPAGAEALVANGHLVLVETGAGTGSGFSDEQYLLAGACIEAEAATVWAAADMIVKVKEPIEAEWLHIKPGQIIFTYFHFAASEALTQAHIASAAICIAYETVELPSRELPLLTPMSEVAGRMAVQEGAKYLEKLQGGRGVLLGGVPGVPPARVLILGGGVVGMNAAKMAAGLGAHVVLLDVALERLRYLSDVMPANVQLIFSDRHTLLKQIANADLVIGAVLTAGFEFDNPVRFDADRIDGWIDSACDYGAGRLIGGQRQGNVIRPCLLEDAPADSFVMNREVFGPVAVLTHHDSFDQALQFVNASAENGASFAR